MALDRKSATDEESQPTISRRRALAIASTGSVSLLAGCGLGGTGDNGGGEDLGERVPPFVVSHFTGAGFITSVTEAAGQVMQQNLQDVGIEMDFIGGPVGPEIGATYNDERRYHAILNYHTPTPDRLDPDLMVRKFGIDWAGPNGRGNIGNYANCEYTDAAVNMRRAGSEEERRELFKEAMGIVSEDAHWVPYSNYISYTAANTAKIDINGVGESGMTILNPSFLYKSRPSGEEKIRLAVKDPTLASANFMTSGAFNQIMAWNHLVHSPLMYYDENYELQNLLATDYQVAEDGTVFTINIRDDINFHNGDPITAEDVVYTYDLITSDPAAYPTVPRLQLAGLEAVDETTVEFTFEDSYLPFITKILPMYGIFHKETWENQNAREDPANFTFDPMIGSGPFRVTHFEESQLLDLEPFEDHILEPDHGVQLRQFTEGATVGEAFRSGEINATGEISAGIWERIQDMDNVQMEIFNGHTNMLLSFDYPAAPSKFRPFRRAVGKAMDRELINQTGLRGEGSPVTYCTHFATNHPWNEGYEDFLYQFTDDPTGDIEDARATLEDAGWGWDNNDQLHYPADADLSALWPKGEFPKAEDFPCVEEYDPKPSE